MDDKEMKLLLEILFRKERLNDLFLQRLVQHLAFVVPEFNGQAFLDTLYLQLEHLQSPDQSEHAEGMLRYWKHKLELTEKALVDAQEMKASI
ncbi:hypothetical protein G6L74_05770 [Agrobacterium tumefaciens]|uniref:hypothetical protein n=1 Tax=Agrobacterium tumefaciens TaxID=358 RepID=UPI00157392B7|nr:hypothetical protein [Agrobacterium tumefaciens]